AHTHTHTHTHFTCLNSAKPLQQITPANAEISQIVYIQIGNGVAEITTSIIPTSAQTVKADRMNRLFPKNNTNSAKTTKPKPMKNVVPSAKLSNTGFIINEGGDQEILSC
ncbi:MAG: hypothetical protein ACI8ZW_002297, partial [Yoonia sp.]